MINVISTIEIEPIELKKIIELKIQPKNFKYKAKDGILNFKKGFFLDLIGKGSKYLINKEWNQEFDEKDPVALLLFKTQRALGYEDCFEGRSLYYRMIINYGSNRTSLVKSNRKNDKRSNKKSRKSRN